MTDPNHSKPGLRPGSGGPAKPASAPSGAASQDKAPQPGSGGRIVHDSRGNAVWQWVKDTGRQAIESTSVLLKKLELPGLKVQDSREEDQLRLEDDVDAGGGYDPYGTKVGTRKPPAPKTPLKKG